MSGILRLESLTKGNTLKQGDKTPLKYRLFDADGEKLSVAGKPAKVRLVYPDFLSIGYEKGGLTVAQDDTVTFTIDNVIPSRIYHVEIIVDEKFIFPSRADESKFTVDKSSLGTESNIVEIVGVDAVVRKAVDLINQDPSLIIDEDKLVTDIISNTGIDSIEEYHQQFTDVLKELSEDKDYHSLPEIAGARGGEDTLGERLDKEHNEVTSQLAQIAINVQDFGAKGDGVNDDRESIQNAIDYVSSLGGGKILFPNGVYNLETKHPDYDALLVIKHSNTSLIGNGQSVSKLVAKTSAESQLLLGTDDSESFEITRTTVEDLTFHGSKLVDYNVKGIAKFVPWTNIRRCLFNSVLETNLYLSPYLSTFDNVTTQDSKIGFHFWSKSNEVVTSITFNSCYANFHSVVGYKLSNLVYSSLNACACDNSKLGYHIFGRGVTLNGCGIEKTDKAMNIENFFGVNINGFFIMNSGSGDINNPTNYLIEFGHGTNATISGVHLHDREKHFDYVLGLTRNSWGFENITILDNSILKNDTYYISNYAFTKPIKFLRGDETKKDQTIEVEPNGLRELLRTFEGMEINHKITIQVLDGTQTSLSESNTISSLRGSGSLIIQGNAQNVESVVITNNTKDSQVKVLNSTPLIIFKNLTIKQVDSNGYSIQASIENSKDVVFSNVKFQSLPINAGAAVYAKEGSKVKLVNGTSATGNYGFGSIYPGTFSFDETSKVTVDAKGEVEIV